MRNRNKRNHNARIVLALICYVIGILAILAFAIWQTISVYQEFGFFLAGETNIIIFNESFWCLLGIPFIIMGKVLSGGAF